MIANRDSLETAERLPRHPPSERDLEIYAAVRVDGRRQADVAAEFGVSQGRVSQILRRVNQWRVGREPAAELERRDDQTVERWLDSQRLEKLYEETMELYRRSCQPRRRERRGTGRQGEWTSEWIDHAPGNMQCLRLAARLLKMRRERDQVTPPSAEALALADERTLFDRLCTMRLWAEQRGDVPMGNGPGDAPGDVVARLLGELLGWRRHEARRMATPIEDVDEWPDDFDSGAVNTGDDISTISAAQAPDHSAASAETSAVRDCPLATSAKAVVTPATPTETSQEANTSKFV